ncbi:PhoD-like phosphatase [Pirellulimonas nuda]|uniref:PhoD-like phosphatase n=1 Tax=Pirellulimonas nuda TaxID=2528009 RepID=A0A518DDH8_9BACT|nr:alkaline phosphatase D family protein [Pirellulimonas nuda]QDU89531.1 PhoD-like phosphatase [Pirellulimonas nuda]
MRAAFLVALGLGLFAPSYTHAAEQQDSPLAVVRIGLAGCHQQTQPAPAFWRYVTAKPDLMLWLGNNVYTDTPDDLAVIEEGHAALASLPAFEQLRRAVPMAATWDDHDYGLNNCGKDYALKEPSKQHFRRFWGLEDCVPADRDGVYHARYFGEGDQRLQVLLLDGRYNRDAPGDDADTLGERQWSWLEEELRRPARLRLIVSGYQVLLDKDAHFETWSKFPRARRRLFDLIRASGAEGVVFLAGDQHYGEASRLPEAIGYDAIELMFCGVNQQEPHVLNRGRVTPVAHAKNAYALLDLQWRASETDEPHLLFRVFDADRDAAELTYRVNFSELRN